MYFTTRTKITLLFTILVGVLLTAFNLVLFESANREWQYKQKDYVTEVMKAMYTPDEAKTRFTHLKVMNSSGEVVHTQGVYSGETMLEKAGSLLFEDEDIYEKGGSLYFSVREEKDGYILDMAEDVTSIIRTRDMIVDRSLWISLFGLLAVIIIGYFFSSYILRPVRHMSERATTFSLGSRDHGKIGLSGHHKDEVTILARSLESLFARVRDEASRLEQFSDDIAHEIKNKLFSIESSLDLALHTEHTKHGVEKAKKMITELSGVVDALLFFARSESGKRESRNLGDYIRSTLDLSDPRIELLEREKVSRDIYPELLSTALGNILSNALKFTREDGSVEIIISETGIEIRDTGAGIRKEDIPRIFDRLWKSDTSRTHGSGHGLGLAIAKKIIEGLHGWTIRVESEEGKGARFLVLW